MESQYDALRLNLRAQKIYCWDNGLNSAIEGRISCKCEIVA